MSHEAQIAIPTTFMRSGTSKGVFFRLQDFPRAARAPGPARDSLLIRVIGSPDPYGKQTDGMGGGTSSTSKVVIVSKSVRQGLMQRRFASINDLPIQEPERKFFWPLGRRPDEHPGLGDLDL